MEITLDKKRTLRFTNRSLFEIEKALGTPVFSLLQDEERLSSVEVLSTLVWGGLIHDKLDRDEVIDIIPLNKFNEVVQSTMAALMDAIGVDEETKKKVKAGTGTGKK